MDIFCWPGIRPADCSQNTGTEPRICTYEKHIPEGFSFVAGSDWPTTDGLQYMVSDSTKFATLPSSSIPRLLNLVPALRHDRREMRVSDDGRPVLLVRSGEEEEGIVIVETKPRMADVRIPELSSASLSRLTNRDRNLSSGLIIYEFQRKESSRLSMSKVDASVDLQQVSP